MMHYRIRLTSSTGRMLELIDFRCENDDVAHEAVVYHIQTNQTAEIWRGTKLVSRVAGRVPLWGGDPVRVLPS